MTKEITTILNKENKRLKIELTNCIAEKQKAEENKVIAFIYGLGIGVIILLLFYIIIWIIR